MQVSGRERAGDRSRTSGHHTRATNAHAPATRQIRVTDGRRDAQIDQGLRRSTVGAGAPFAIPRLFRIFENHPRVLRMAVDRPRPNGPTAAGCPIQYAAIRDSHGVTLGTLWLRECFDRIETVVADNLADRYCINSVI